MVSVHRMINGKWPASIPRALARACRDRIRRETMENWSAFTLAALAAILAGAGIAGGQVDTTQALVRGNTEFALDLYAQLAQEKGNLFFSPYSISNALAMAYDGAGGATAAEMKNVLHFPFNHHELNPAFGDLIRQLQEG